MFSLKSNFNKIYICNQGLENYVTKIWKTYFYIMKKKSIEDWKGDYKFHQRGFIHLMFAVSRSWTFVILLRHDSESIQDTFMDSDFQIGNQCELIHTVFSAGPFSQRRWLKSIVFILCYLYESKILFILASTYKLRG